MCNTNDAVHYESGTSSVQARMCSRSQAHHHYKRGCEVQASISSYFGTEGGGGGHYSKILSSE